MKKIRLFAFLIAFLQALSLLPVSAFAIENSEVLDNSVDLSLSYLSKKQYEDGTWGEIGKIQTDDINQILEYMYYTDYESDIIVRMLDKTSDYFYILDVLNNENLSQFLLIDDIRDEDAIICLCNSQNSDGGFGLAEGYTSDIIDTKLTLKALTDIGETEAMTNAALYISSLQNEDGGFGYQQGLSSNAYLTADIANILVDTIDVNPILSYYLEDTFTALDSYLDSTFPVLNELSSSDLDTVYQHFHTALYRLKRDGRYDVTPYYALQAEDGGVFDDPMATALYLELLVREQNALVAKIDNIAITNDRGYAVSAFNSNENVNISVINEFETDKAHFEMSIIKPDGTIVPLNGDIAIWNTTDNPDGEYTVRAEIIRNSNDEVTTSLEQTFRI